MDIFIYSKKEYIKYKKFYNNIFFKNILFFIDNLYEKNLKIIVYFIQI
jgi:hypothetical protein